MEVQTSINELEDIGTDLAFYVERPENRGIIRTLTTKNSRPNYDRATINDIFSKTTDEIISRHVSLNDKNKHNLEKVIEDVRSKGQKKATEDYIRGVVDNISLGDSDLRYPAYIVRDLCGYLGMVLRFDFPMSEAISIINKTPRLSEFLKECRISSFWEHLPSDKEEAKEMISKLKSTGMNSDLSFLAGVDPNLAIDYAQDNSDIVKIVNEVILGRLFYHKGEAICGGATQSFLNNLKSKEITLTDLEYGKILDAAIAFRITGEGANQPTPETMADILTSFKNDVNNHLKLRPNVLVTLYENGRLKILDALVAKGADPELKCSDGVSLVDHIEKESQKLGDILKSMNQSVEKYKSRDRRYVSKN